MLLTTGVAGYMEEGAGRRNIHHLVPWGEETKGCALGDLENKAQ